MATASAVYTKPCQHYDSAIHATPSDLTASERNALEGALRVDQAGEIAANYIYQGQMAVLGRDKHLGPLIQASFAYRLCFPFRQTNLLFTGYVGSREEAPCSHGQTTIATQY